MLNCPEQQSWTMWVVEVKIADTVRYCTVVPAFLGVGGRLILQSKHS